MADRGWERAREEEDRERLMYWLAHAQLSGVLSDQQDRQCMSLNVKLVQLLLPYQTVIETSLNCLKAAKEGGQS
jgi:hypothetical protein